MPQYLSADKEKELVETAALLMTKGKGLLAADESTGTDTSFVESVVDLCVSRYQVEGKTRSQSNLLTSSINMYLAYQLSYME